MMKEEGGIWVTNLPLLHSPIMVVVRWVNYLFELVQQFASSLGNHLIVRIGEIFNGVH